MKSGLPVGDVPLSASEQFDCIRAGLALRLAYTRHASLDYDSGMVVHHDQDHYTSTLLNRLEPMDQIAMNQCEALLDATRDESFPVESDDPLQLEPRAQQQLAHGGLIVLEAAVAGYITPPDHIEIPSDNLDTETIKHFRLAVESDHDLLSFEEGTMESLELSDVVRSIEDTLSGRDDVTSVTVLDDAYSPGPSDEDAELVGRIGFTPDGSDEQHALRVEGYASQSGHSELHLQHIDPGNNVLFTVDLGDDQSLEEAVDSVLQTTVDESSSMGM